MTFHSLSQNTGQATFDASTEADRRVLIALWAKDRMSHQPVIMELRNRVRYRLSADAVFAWHGPQGKRLLAEGLTRDISVAGAFIFTRTCPPVGATLDLEIFLPSSPALQNRMVQIKTVASVIRVEHEFNREGFAATSQDFTLLFDRNTRNALGISSVDKDE